MTISLRLTTLHAVIAPTQRTTWGLVFQSHRHWSGGADELESNGRAGWRDSGIWVLDCGLKRISPPQPPKPSILRSRIHIPNPKCRGGGTFPARAPHRAGE